MSSSITSDLFSNMTPGLLMCGTFAVLAALVLLAAAVVLLRDRRPSA